MLKNGAFILFVYMYLRSFFSSLVLFYTPVKKMYKSNKHTRTHARRAQKSERKKNQTLPLLF